MKKYCKGCGTVDCYLKEFNKSGECPCTDCLVKTMCNSSCPKYFYWRAANHKEGQYVYHKI
jgi:hypothetical protein